MTGRVSFIISDFFSPLLSIFRFLLPALCLSLTLHTLYSHLLLFCLFFRLQITFIVDETKSNFKMNLPKKERKQNESKLSSGFWTSHTHRLTLLPNNNNNKTENYQNYIHLSCCGDSFLFTKSLQWTKKPCHLSTVFCLLNS